MATLFRVLATSVVVAASLLPGVCVGGVGVLPDDPAALYASWQVEMAIDLASSANKVANGEAHAPRGARVYTPSRSAEGASPTSNRKVTRMEEWSVMEEERLRRRSRG